MKQNVVWSRFEEEFYDMQIMKLIFHEKGDRFEGNRDFTSLRQMVANKQTQNCGSCRHLG